MILDGLKYYSQQLHHLPLPARTLDSLDQTAMCSLWYAPLHTFHLPVTVIRHTFDDFVIIPSINVSSVTCPGCQARSPHRPEELVFG